MLDKNYDEAVKDLRQCIELIGQVLKKRERERERERERAEWPGAGRGREGASERERERERERADWPGATPLPLLVHAFPVAGLGCGLRGAWLSSVSEGLS